MKSPIKPLTTRGSGSLPAVAIGNAGPPINANEPCTLARCVNALSQIYDTALRVPCTKLAQDVVVVVVVVVVIV